jgi:hypothetical protein
VYTLYLLEKKRLNSVLRVVLEKGKGYWVWGAKCSEEVMRKHGRRERPLSSPASSTCQPVNHPVGHPPACTIQFFYGLRSQ